MFLLGDDVFVTGRGADGGTGRLLQRLIKFNEKGKATYPYCGRADEGGELYA